MTRYTADAMDREASSIDNGAIGDDKTSAMLKQSAVDQRALRALVDAVNKLRERRAMVKRGVAESIELIGLEYAVVDCADELAAIIGEQQ